MDYEETIAFLGPWGRFQQIVVFLLSASFIQNGINTFSIVFVGDSPAHHCLVPEVNLTDYWHNAIIPIEVVDGEQQLSSCSRYRLDVVRNLSAQGLIPGRDINLTDVAQEGCVDGWSYSRDTYKSTIVTEFDLVCSEGWKQPFTSTVLFLGILFGSFFVGQISDRFGRKPILIATMAAQTVFNFVEIFSPTWTVFCIFYFLNGFSHASNYVAGFVLGTELLTGNVRIMFSSLTLNIGFSVGYMLLPVSAYLLRDWKYLLSVVSLPGFVFIPIWWLIPESPRWLLSVRRVAEAEAIVRRIARFNQVEAPLVIFEDYSTDGNGTKTHPEKHSNILHLLKTRTIRNTSIIVCVVWFSVRIGYHGLSLNTSHLHADPFLSCFISAVIELPAYVSIWLAVKFIPRRLTVICILLTEALSLYFIQLVPQSVSYIAVALEMLGKFAITAGAALMYVYTAELYPTVIRSTGTGACSTVARVGSCFAPFLLSLSAYYTYLPQITFGTMGIVSAFAAFFLPETFGHPLPQTIKEMRKRERPPSHLDVAPSHLDVAPSHLDRPPSHLDRPLSHLDVAPSHLDRPPSHLDVAPSHLDRHPSHLDRPPSHLDVAPPPSHLDRPPSHLDRPPSHLDRPPSHLDVAPSHLDVAPSHLDVAPSHLDRPPSHLDRPPSHLDRPPSHLDDLSLYSVPPQQKPCVESEAGHLEERRLPQS
ncbi:organic cation/carnitine transporter 2-like [Brachionichthys hirsutus]|uniref:organic cation/carnitine transporter 2-like n=1 Tax=Brachionichthys hirsutus TaxID=412623 RepID=UPI0036047028